MLLKWVLAILAVVGGFFVAGIAGGVATDFAGFWLLPGAGFSAAFAVVIVAYLAAPSHRVLSSIVALVIVAAVAWYFLEPSFTPESYGENGAYQPTHLPIIATYLGGILGLVVAAGLGRFARLTDAIRPSSLSDAD
jgi:hypothetical protein